MILVTGAAGYIGSQIVHQLHRYYEQPKVIGVDNLSTGYTCNLPHGFECLMGDVGHTAFMGNVIERYKVKQIVHCAASISAPESVADPLLYFHNNAVKSYDLIRTAVDKCVEGFVFASSAAVYGQPEFDRPMQEDDPKRPMSPYGWSKLTTEQLLRDTRVVNGMNTVILRFFNVAGADPLGQTGETSPRVTHLIKRACQAALGSGKPFELYGDGKDVRDYVHVADVAQAVTRALEWTERHNGCLTLNVGSGKGSNIQEVLARLSWVTKQSFPITVAQRREGDPVSIVADTRLLRDRFNWEPQYDLNAMLEHALKWEKTL